MNITVLGAGGMGLLFGGLLAESGSLVPLLDINDAQINAIRSSGLNLQTDKGQRVIHNIKINYPSDNISATGSINYIH